MDQQTGMRKCRCHAPVAVLLELIVGGMQNERNITDIRKIE
jgi:hypothetical protein